MIASIWAVFIHILSMSVWTFERASSQDDVVYGCGGFIKSSLPIDYTNVKVRLYTRNGHLKYVTECAPNNGYYMIPVYSKGAYTIKVEPPVGWEFDPQNIDVIIDGVSDSCTLGHDLNFNFKGFSVVGIVCTDPECSQLAKDHEIDLYAEDDMSKHLITSKTNELGQYIFYGISPGQYVVRNVDNSVCMSEAQDVRVTVSQTAFSGQVLDSGKPVQNVRIYLYANGNSKLKARNCDFSTHGNFLTQNDASFICSTVTNDEGWFSFSCLESARYFLLAKYEINGLKFDVSPERIDFEVKDRPIFLKESFSLNGFSLTGRVLFSQNGKAIQGAEIFFDGQKLDRGSNHQGQYTLTKVYPGKHKITASIENAEFEPLNVDVSVLNHKIPDMIPVRFNLCGRFNKDNNEDSSVFKKMKIKLTDLEGRSSVVSVTIDEHGKFCKMVPPSNYPLEPQILAEEKKESFSIVPRQKRLTVKDQPILNVIFDQFRAKVSGSIKCLGIIPYVELLAKSG